MPQPRSLAEGMLHIPLESIHLDSVRCYLKPELSEVRKGIRSFKRPDAGRHEVDWGGGKAPNRGCKHHVGYSPRDGASLSLSSHDVGTLSQLLQSAATVLRPSLLSLVHHHVLLYYDSRPGLERTMSSLPPGPLSVWDEMQVQARTKAPAI